MTGVTGRFGVAWLEQRLPDFAYQVFHVGQGLVEVPAVPYFSLLVVRLVWIVGLAVSVFVDPVVQLMIFAGLAAAAE